MMDGAVNLRVGLNSLKRAQLYYENSNYGRAFAHFLVYFELIPNGAPYKDQFIQTLFIWGKQLEERKQQDDLCKCYIRALKYFPGDVTILHNYAAHLIKMDYNEKTKRYMELSYALTQSNLISERNVQALALHLMPRWHFRMVNDYERNMAYYKAILAFSSDQEVKVLDIGTGCGLLSLFASNNTNVISIYAVECEDSMVTIANNVFNDNQKKNICLINEYSTDLSVEDICGKADLLVTEIFDCALFGEHVLETLIHAWEKLLTTDAKIIPASATLYITGIECSDILLKQRVVHNIEELKLNQILTSKATREPYDAQNLKTLQWKQITRTETMLTVNFYDLQQLKNIFYAKDDFHVTLTCIDNGQIDAFAVWFNLNLDDNITLTTNPKIDNVKCWEQGIFSINFPRYYNCGEHINLDFSCRESFLNVKYVDEIKMDGLNFLMCPDVITYLNDTSIVTAMKNLASNYHNVTAMDLSPFPLFGLLLAKNGSKCYCRERDESQVNLINHLICVNNIGPDNFTLLSDVEIDKVLAEKNDFDVILVDFISENGTLEQNVVRGLSSYELSLKPAGHLLPKSISLIGEIIESDYLLYCNRASDENSFGFKISDHINAFAINEHWMIDKKLQHKKLTEQLVVDIKREDGDELLSEHVLQVVQTGRTDGVLYWFELNFDHGIQINTFDSIHYNCASFLLDKYDTVHKNMYVKLSVKQHNGLLKVYFNC